MPIYEYRCSKCAKEFERVVFASDEYDAQCPECGAMGAQKVMSVFSASTADGKSGASCGPSSGGFS
jgi:putative FmdB family regulatory protein